jgi:glycosyltransferase involved in cell wall biosynthesis
VIRVGFLFASADTSWLGGTSYYRNLFSAIMDLPERKIDPVILASGYGREKMRGLFSGVDVLHLPLLDAPRFFGRFRRAVQLMVGRDVFLEHALRGCEIDLISHSGDFGKRSTVPSITWIPDFQELAFPEFFSSSERAARRRNLVRSCRHASLVLLSSKAALSDLRDSGMGNEAATAVLPFVAAVPTPSSLTGVEELRTRYGIGERFFHLPNQFWIHKNHKLVIEAIALLKQQGGSFEVIATGNTHDPRQPDHFASLLDFATELGVKHLFRPLGVVPYADLMGLMRHAVAVINPSKFEGWSTTVEEAKSMGKAVLLSDIPVHREQAPDRAIFFAPDDPRALASAMADAWNRWNEDDDMGFINEAMVRLPERRREFARRYENIVLNTMAGKRGG